MLLAVVPDPVGGARLRRVADDGRPAGPVEEVTDLAAVAHRIEQDWAGATGGAGGIGRPGGVSEASGIGGVGGTESGRWLWASTAECYPRLVRAGVRVARCHDLELTEALLLGYQGRWGEPRGIGAAWARLTGAPVPADPIPRAATPPGDGQAALFETAPARPVPSGTDPLAALIAVYADQQTRIDGLGGSGAPPDAARRFRLLVAAESAGALSAVEMGQDGLPWRADVHDALLLELLGEPSPVGPPRRLAELTEQIVAAFHGHRVNPESPGHVRAAFAREGIRLPSTRAFVLRQVDHPAAPLLLEFKELYRIWTAHGWAWRQAWVRHGRFRPEYVAGGVVSGRWATRGGGALQIPKVIRAAVRADEGWKLVVADAGQLEPRILAAVSGDGRMARAGAAGDLYAALAEESFGGDRSRAKVALLGAMYGQTGGQAVPALATLRRSYPTALSYVEHAARVGEGGGLVRSWLGRTCPPPGVAEPAFAEDPGATAEHAGPLADADPTAGEGRAGEWRAGEGQARARARGRFTRNFVIQATAAEWALVLLAFVRTALFGSAARLVFFQHDEVIVHAPAAEAEAVARAVTTAGERTGRLLFGDSPVRFPIDLSIVDSYAEAK